MALKRKLSNGIKMETAIFMLVFSLTLFSSESDGTGLGTEGGGGGGVEPMKWVLGSRPPRCLNKCLSCWPCKAVLIVSEHHHKNGAEEESAGREDGYYLLLWKCKCKDKFFHP